MPHVRSLSCGLLSTPSSPNRADLPGEPLQKMRAAANALSAFPNVETLSAGLELPEAQLQEPRHPDAPQWTRSITSVTNLSLDISPPPYGVAGALPLSPLTRLSSLTISYGSRKYEAEAPFTAERTASFMELPALRHLSLTLVNHAFEQAAADMLALGSQLTSLELLRVVCGIPMAFFDFHLGVNFLTSLTCLRRLKLNFARRICKLDEASWQPLAQLACLEDLALSGVPNPCLAFAYLLYP
jgi:hypothetical protein